MSLRHAKTNTNWPLDRLRAKNKTKINLFSWNISYSEIFSPNISPLFYFEWHFIARWKWPSFLILIVSFNIYKIYSFFPSWRKRIFKKTLLMQQLQHLLESNSCTISKTAHSKNSKDSHKVLKCSKDISQIIKSEAVSPLKVILLNSKRRNSRSCLFTLTDSQLDNMF